MSRRLAITAQQVTALCKGAAKAGYIPEVQIGDVVVRLLPEALVSPLIRASVAEEEEEEFAPHGYVAWPGPELNHREEKVLQTLVDKRGQYLPASGVAYAGPATVKGLLEHGLVEAESGKEDFDRSQMIRATAAGLRFFSERKEHYRKYPWL